MRSPRARTPSATRDSSASSATESGGQLPELFLERVLGPRGDVDVPQRTDRGVEPRDHLVRTHVRKAYRQPRRPTPDARIGPVAVPTPNVRRRLGDLAPAAAPRPGRPGRTRPGAGSRSGRAPAACGSSTPVTRIAALREQLLERGDERDRAAHARCPPARRRPRRSGTPHRAASNTGPGRVDDARLAVVFQGHRHLRRPTARAAPGARAAPAYARLGSSPGASRRLSFALRGRDQGVRRLGRSAGRRCRARRSPAWSRSGR